MVVHMLVIVLRAVIAALVGASLWFLVQSWRNGKNE